MLYAYGAPFKRGFTTSDAEIYDLVPTLLRAMDLPLPHAFDGRVLDELFVEKQQSELPATGEGKSARHKLKKLLEI